MLESVLHYLHNWFLVAVYDGLYTIKDGSIELPFLQSGQYFRIVGSILNDGVYNYPAENLKDEEFTGSIWALAVPPAVLSLVEEITAWQAKNGASGPYTSESFGGYSYSKATGTNGQPAGWQDVFRSRLNAYRKMPGTVGRHEAHVLDLPYNPDYPFGGVL